MVFVLIGISAHPLWIGLILSYVFGFRLGLAPIGGYCDIFSPRHVRRAGAVGLSPGCPGSPSRSLFAASTCG